MRILFSADLHFGSSDHVSRINPATGFSTRLEDFLATFEQIVAYAVDPAQQIDLVVLAGDIYKTRQPTNTQQSEFAKRLKSLSDAGIPTTIINGNHDILVSHGSAATSEIYASLKVPNVDIKSKPALGVYGDVYILYMPFAHRGKLGLSTNEELCKWYCDKVRKFVKYADEKDARAKIVVGHQTLEGTTLLSGIHDLKKTSELIIPLDVFEGTDFVLYGHIHRYQVLKQNPYIVIPGSMDTLDFAEAEESKGFIVYDTNTKSAKRIPLRTKPLVHLKFVFDSETDPAIVTNTILAQICDTPLLPDTIIKVNIDIPESLNAHLDLHAIEDQMGQAAFALRPIVNIKRAKRLRNETITEALPVEKTLEEFFREREDVADILDDILLTGRTIIATTQTDKVL